MDRRSLEQLLQVAELHAKGGRGSQKNVLFWTGAHVGGMGGDGGEGGEGGGGGGGQGGGHA